MKWCDSLMCLSYVDSLVFDLQFIHDGDIPRRSSEHDINAYVAQGLRSIQQGRRWRRHGNVYICDVYIDCCAFHRVNVKHIHGIAVEILSVRSSVCQTRVL